MSSTMTVTNPYTIVKDYKIPSVILAKAFQTIKVNQYVTLDCPFEENLEGFEHRLQQLLDEGSLIVVDDDLSSAAVWIPPQVDYPKYDCELNERYQWLEDEIERCSNKFLKGRPYWHLTLLGKDPDRKDIKGSISKLVKPFLEKAIQENVPAVLEAIDDRARDIYLHYGFKIYEVIEVGGGLKAYYMIYNY